MIEPVASDVRFAFGENWSEFRKQIDDRRIAESEKAIVALLGRSSLDGLSFLDVGSGSGLSSLAARRLGARVHSFDYDVNSVKTTKALREQYRPNDPDWIVEQGSILEQSYLAKLGRFDIVYSWGVLHHTGAMNEAIERAAALVADGGLFAFALYRKTRLCWAWKLEKRWYAQASKWPQKLARNIYIAMMRLAFLIAGTDFKAYVADYHRSRGMSYIHDVHDWMGGWPYDSIRPSEVAGMMERLAFEPVRSTVGRYEIGWLGSGCDEFVYRQVTTRRIPAKS